MKHDEVVLERNHRAPQSPLETPDLRAALDDALVRGTYLTAPEAALYTRRGSVRSFYKWRVKYAVKTYRGGDRGALLFRREDLDEALKPTEERGRRRHFASMRGGRS